MRVLRLPPDIINQYLDGGVDFPVIVYGGVEGDRVLVAGGLSWQDGRCYAWLDAFDDVGANAMLIFRQAKRMLRMAGQLGETEAFVFRDEHVRSAKLLRMLGFVFVEMDEPTGKEIWKCQV